VARCCEHFPASRNSLEGADTAGLETEIGTSHEVGDSPRDERLSRGRGGADAGCDVDGQPGQVIADAVAFSRVNADTKLEAEPA
jgi:hypothetical protein